jgi:hypothetical protein
VRAISRFDRIPSRIINSSCPATFGSTTPPSSGTHSCTPKCSNSGAIAANWLPKKARSLEPITTASKVRSGSDSAPTSAAASSRRAQGTTRL